MFRLIAIISRFLKYLRLYRLYPSLRNQNRGARLRMACERSGLVFVKACQMYANRKPFAEEPESQSELEKILDRTEPFPFAVMRPIIENELGKSIEEYFDKDSFEEEAYASASIAQTYVAKCGGIKMMVKVLRPGVFETVEKDLRLARRLVAVASWVSKRVRSMRSAKIFEQWGTGLRQEIDFLHEEWNCAQCRAAFPKLTFPKVTFSSRKLLVQTFIEGIPLNRWDEKYRAEGYDPQESLQWFLRQTFGPSFRGIAKPVIADCLSSNLIVLKNGTMGVVDFGLIGYTTQNDLRMIRNLVFSIYAQDVKRGRKELLRFCGHTFRNKRKEKAFKRDAKRYIEECPRQPFSYWLFGAGRLLANHGIPAPEVFALICMFGIKADAIGQTFFPHSTTVDLIGEDIRAGMLYDAFERFGNADPLMVLYALSVEWERLPRRAAAFIRDPAETIAEAVDPIVRIFREAA